MELEEAFGATLRQARLLKGLTQEHFSLVSSRTHVSLLERGGTSPTRVKLEELCSVLGVHPVSLVTACYMRKENIADLNAVLAQVRKDLKAIDS